MKKLSIHSFVNPSGIDKAIIENNNPNNFAPPPAVVPRNSPDWFKGFKDKYSGNANKVTVYSGGGPFSTLSPNAAALKTELIKFIIKQFPSSLLLSVDDDFASLYNNPIYKELFIELRTNIGKWLQSQKDVIAARELSSATGNNLVQLIYALVPEVTAFLHANPGITGMV